jgi:hypothetical protein
VAGFIGVRYTEMVVVEPDTKFIDIYYTFNGTDIHVVFVDGTYEGRADPEPTIDIHRVWSYSDVNNVRALTTPNDGTHKINTSQNGGTGWLPQVVPVEVVAELSADKLYGMVEGGPIRLSVTGGTTWFDHIAVPGGRSGFGDVKVTKTHLYAITNPVE